MITVPYLNVTDRRTDSQNCNVYGIGINGQIRYVIVSSDTLTKYAEGSWTLTAVKVECIVIVDVILCHLVVIRWIEIAVITR